MPDWAAVGRLRGISQPTLILKGDDDITIPTAASHTLAALIPNAKVTIYPDAPIWRCGQARPRRYPRLHVPRFTQS